MEKENIYNKLNEILGQMGGSFSILEDEIDVDLQMEYFEFSKNFKRTREFEEIIDSKDDIFSENISFEDKKTRFVELASIDDIEAFRTIEQYLQKPETKFFKSWATLAYQESRMLLESRLLDENQVFISTGLGGKDEKLRYFFVLLLKEGDQFEPYQKRIIKNEFSYLFEKRDSEIEEIQFHEKFATILALIPLEHPIKELFDEGIDQCNQLGEFLNEDFIVTNIKKLTIEEIEEYYNSKEASQK